MKKEGRKQARAAKEEAEARTIQKRGLIRAKVAEAKDEGFPADVEEREAFFMQEVGRGEAMNSDGLLYRISKLRLMLIYVPGSEDGNIEAALSFYKALKVYPQPSDLIS